MNQKTHIQKHQMIDIVKAHAYNHGAGTDQIEACEKLRGAELADVIKSMLRNGHIITAHLTKTKASGFGFLTFGCNGKTAPGTYHKITVSSHKDARKVAAEHGAQPHNF